ncbi:MAG: TIGR03905 family TSCPD domain-containing protein [Clostridia bacterium]|nr:TIGR03905 family TSCPD domain-containing protein [Clostridia bacterium]MBQ4289878.1 TIGR03905 family TSCPD domain-containing protein [Clostridia bacterium]
MDYTYQTSMTCSRSISFHLEGDVVTNISFVGGCNGNLKAISKLLEGKTVGYIEEKLLGNTCGFRPTSCADQLARAVREAYDKQNAGEA